MLPTLHHHDHFIPARSLVIVPAPSLLTGLIVALPLPITLGNEGTQSVITLPLDVHQFVIRYFLSYLARRTRQKK